jgi:hypothetical protein
MEEPSCALPDTVVTPNTGGLQQTLTAFEDSKRWVPAQFVARTVAYTDSAPHGTTTVLKSRQWTAFPNAVAGANASS